MERQVKISPIEQHVIDFVKKLRTERQLTQTDIADIIGVSRTFVTQAENKSEAGKYNLRHINALAEHFGMSPREFLPERAVAEKL
ncbi:helix-turn-helix transcriptional regulator [Paraflavitalea sp. CAU 1676]|uniref:helix-turn-helix domain-containing protein n=1 Tax=Paraflavitalea sp. CAU 1676 TaxID=3032598 RepID=UPI0023DC7DF6|nr:helix-turn-helix transcriptional regulator [Paraflavitalea sp. CAU 1676]MDF2188542.1 helix-turn-helix transcriptional regulator [Paraflavitalea sp. CAU 1676]